LQKPRFVGLEHTTTRLNGQQRKRLSCPGKISLTVFERAHFERRYAPGHQLAQAAAAYETFAPPAA